MPTLPVEAVKPHVCGVMLSHGRAEMKQFAIDAFWKQSYHHKSLLIWTNEADKPIGELRNEANDYARADILIHWDDDDWSHPNRIAEQVALIQASGADCVGYREMLFWREVEQEAWLYVNDNPNWALGTSLCYWRKAWERRPFEAISHGEDTAWLRGLKVASISSLTSGNPKSVASQSAPPYMIARIHAGNAGNNAYNPEEMAKASEWQSVPAWDGFCREVFA